MAKAKAKAKQRKPAAKRAAKPPVLRSIRSVIYQVSDRSRARAFYGAYWSHAARSHPAS